MKLITKDIGYALRILIYMGKEQCRVFSVRHIAKAVSIPHAFARRICQRMSKANIISSHKGKGGGVMLCEKPSKVSVLDVIRVFQGEVEFLDCFVKGKLCSQIKKCPVRKKLKRIEKEVSAKLDRISLKELLEVN